MPFIKSRISLVLAAVVLVLLAAQAVPYGRQHTNPPVVAEPRWDSPVTRDLVRQACFDCHSNETEWPIYARVAPVSWLIQHDVDEGRAVLNFSEWQRRQEESGEAAETVQEGEMPPKIYSLVHAHARLTSVERDLLSRGLATTLGRSTDEEREHR